MPLPLRYVPAVRETASASPKAHDAIFGPGFKAGQNVPLGRLCARGEKHGLSYDQCLRPAVREYDIPLVKREDIHAAYLW